MNRLEDVPDPVYRAIFFGIVFYFVLLVYGQMTGEELALLAAEFVFGVIAVGVGTVLFLQSRSGTGHPAVLAGAGCLVAGGAFQFAYLFTRIAVLDVVSSIGVFVGIGLYIYAAWDLD